MAWTGYNTEESLQVILQQSSEWTDISKPLTITDVERINKQIYNEINLELAAEGIDTDGLTEEELDFLNLINDYGSADVIVKVKYQDVPQGLEDRSKEKEMPESSFRKRYEKALNNFVKIKRKKRMDYSAFGVHSTVKETTPIFERDTEW